MNCQEGEELHENGAVKRAEVVSPFQGSRLMGSKPRAVPWAVLLRSFRAIKEWLRHRGRGQGEKRR